MRSRNNHVRTRARVAIATAVALVLGACSQGEPEKSPVRPATPAPMADAPAAGTSPEGNYAPGDALKERLARQDAAARMIDAPPPARAPEPPKPAPLARAPEPVKATPALPAVASPKSPPPKSVEPVAVAPAPTPPPASAPKATPPAPRTDVAVAKPQPAASVTRLVQRVEPEFPREAIQAGEEKGLVQARLTLDERGNVTRVEVLDAYPRRVFDRSVIRALSQWKYNDGAVGRTVELEIAFKK